MWDARRDDRLADGWTRLDIDPESSQSPKRRDDSVLPRCRALTTALAKPSSDWTTRRAPRYTGMGTSTGNEKELKTEEKIRDAGKYILSLLLTGYFRLRVDMQREVTLM